ncbi:MAG: hypothetical protein ACOYYJ_15100 [Chloroflexota bacterium]
MTTIWEIQKFRERLTCDPENWEARRSFHENYEWLEGYWRSQFGENYFEQVWDKDGDYYWQNIPDIQQIAKEFAVRQPVGNNRDVHYQPSPEVIAATDLLKVLNQTPKLHFKALMVIVRQIRNNMFHGKKMEVTNEVQYRRNKELIKFASKVTGLILDNLQ